MQPARAHERSAFGLRLAKSSHPDLRRLRGLDSPRAQGHKTWNAGWLLIDFLQRQRLEKGLRVLDIGCGWGLCGIFCARRAAAVVTAADIDPRVFPYLNLHAQLNEVEIATCERSFAQMDSALLAEQCCGEKMSDGRLPHVRRTSEEIGVGRSRDLLRQ